MVKDLMAAQLFYQPAKRAFEYTQWPIIRIDGNGNWDAVPAEWGIIPPWIKTRDEATMFKYKFPTYNAIGDELFEKRSFVTPARKYRCLVPSTGFYESMHVPKIGKSGKPLKQTDSIPFFIYVKDEPVFFMAGIYSPWFDPDKDDWINTFSICTADAGPVMTQIHNVKKRQPTILPTDLAERWTDKDLSDKEIIAIASHQFDNSKLQYHTVKKSCWLDDNPDEEVHYDNVPEIIP